MYFTNTEIQTAKEKLNSGAIKSDLVQKLNDSNSEIQNLKLSTSEIEGIGISNSVRALGSNDILKVDSTLGNKKKILCIGLGSAELYRNWPYKYYIELLELLREDYSLVLLGSKDSNIYPSYTIDFRGIGFRESCAVLKLSDGLLTVDTSFLHASAAFGIPTIALFGPIDYRARCKGYNNVLVVKSDLPCIPCWRNGDIKCKLCNSNEEYSKCMTSIYPKRLSEIIKNKFV
jgi:heptosyltransferase-2